MAYDSTSTWSSSRKNPLMPDEVDATGLTKKQRDMSTARNPMNNNVPNTAGGKPQDAGLTKGEQKKPPNPMAGQRAQQAQQSVQELRGKLGSTAYEVQGLVNKFLKQGNAQAGIKSGPSVTFKDGRYTVDNANPQELDVSAAVAEKTGQLREIQESAKDFFYQDPAGKWKKKTTDDAIKTVTDYDQLDESGKARVDELTGLVKLINEYENRGLGKSAEAQALKEQLASMDQNGIVSGLYKAIDDYKKFASDDSSAQWYGDEGDEGLSLEEILSFDEKRIEEELRDAVTLGKGIFSGTYESGLKRQVDTESAEAQQAAKSEAQYRNDLVDASKGFITNYQTKFVEKAGVIKDAFTKAAPSVISKLQADTTPTGKAALQFFVSLQSADDKDLATVISRLLYDPSLGLQRGQREKIAEYLGASGILPGGKDEGKLAGWLSDLGQFGYIEEDGKKVELNAEEKYMMLTALRSGKSEDAASIVKSAMVRSDIDLDSALQQATATGNIAQAVEGFASSISDSLKTFAGSRTEDGVRRALGITEDKWKAMGQDERSAAISQALAENPKLLMESVDSAANDYKKQATQVVEAKKKELADASVKLDEKLKQITEAQPKIQEKYAELGNRLYQYMYTYVTNASTAFGTYEKYFNANSNYFVGMLGKKPAELNSAAHALSLRDSLKQLSKDNPTMFKLVSTGEVARYLALDSKSAVAAAVSDDKMVNTFLQFYKDIETNPVTQARIIDNYPGLKQQKSLIDQMAKRAAESLAQGQKMKADITKQTGSLDTFSKSLDTRIFSPEEISRLAQEVGHTIEGSTAVTTGMGEITPQDIAAGSVDMGDFTSQDLAGVNAESSAISQAPEALTARFGEDTMKLVGPNDPVSKVAATVSEKDMNAWVGKNKGELDRLGKDISNEFKQYREQRAASGQPLFSSPEEFGKWLSDLGSRLAPYAGKGTFVLGGILKILGTLTANPALAGLGEIGMYGGTVIEAGVQTVTSINEANQRKLEQERAAELAAREAAAAKTASKSKYDETAAREGKAASIAQRGVDQGKSPEEITKKTGYHLPVSNI